MNVAKTHTATLKALAEGQRIGLTMVDSKPDSGLAKIVRIIPGGTAAECGQLQRGDLILSINGREAVGHKRAAAELKACAHGEITLLILRDEDAESQPRKVSFSSSSFGCSSLCPCLPTSTPTSMRILSQCVGTDSDLKERLQWVLRAAAIYDVLLLQQIFGTASLGVRLGGESGAVEASLRKRGFKYCVRAAAPLGFKTTDSGCLVASRWPLLDVQQLTYAARGAHEARVAGARVSKGAILVRLQVPCNRRVTAV